MKVKDKVAIVTGASSGIGYATAELLSKKGAIVVLVARSENKLLDLSKKLNKSLALVADLSKKDEVRKTIKKVVNKFGRIDILVNNAGVGYDAPLEKINIDKLQYVFELDVVGPLVAMQEVIPFMRKQKGGVIVNISSGTSLMYLPNMSAYSSMKRAINGLSLTARDELKNDNISVSVVYPYMTQTNFDANMLSSDNAESDYENNRVGRGLPPHDTAEHVATKILEAIEGEKAQVYAHEWMKKL